MSFLINQHVTAGAKLNSFLSKSSACFKCYAATFRSGLNSSLSNKHQFLQHGFHDQNTLLRNLYPGTRNSFELHEFVYWELGQPAVCIHIFCSQYQSTGDRGKYVVISADVKHSLVLPKQLLLLIPMNLLQTLSFRLGPVDRGRITGRVQPVISQQCSLMNAAQRERLRSRPDGGNLFSAFR